MIDFFINKEIAVKKLYCHELLLTPGAPFTNMV